VLNVFELQNYFVLTISLATFIAKAWAFIDSAARPAQAFEAGNKMTKTGWMIILGLAVAVHMLNWYPIGLLNIVGIVAALVYLLDVRPVLKSMTRRR
jgi:hypothetical protein